MLRPGNVTWLGSRKVATASKGDEVVGPTEHKAETYMTMMNASFKLPAGGTYKARIEGPGFKTIEKRGFYVVKNKDNDLLFIMDPGDGVGGVLNVEICYSYNSQVPGFA